jgi:hypothetical protein
MKKLLIATFSLLFGLLAMTACENQTDGLLPEPTAQAAPPEYVLAAVKLQYPNATNVKITVIQPNKIWRVEFTVSGEIFETFIDENGQTITNARLGTLNEDEALEKVRAYIRAQKRSSRRPSIQKIRHPETRQLLYFQVLEIRADWFYKDDPAITDKNVYGYLFDKNGNFLSSSGVTDGPYLTGDIRGKEFRACYFDFENKKMVWGTYVHTATFPDAITSNTAIYNTLEQLGWVDNSGISPVLTKEDYPQPSQTVSVYKYLHDIQDRLGLLANVHYMTNGWSFSGTTMYNTRFSLTSPHREKYIKFFEEQPSRFKFFVKSDGKPLYILEQWFRGNNPFDNLININKNDVPASVLNEMNAKNLPPIDFFITGTRYSYPPTTTLANPIVNHTIFYKGAKGEMVQIMTTETEKGFSRFGYQVVEPAQETEIRPVFLEAVKRRYPNLKISVYRKFRVEDKTNGTPPAITDYNGFEIIFESEGKTYSAVGVGAIGFDKPIIQQLY